jgi:zinc transporter ZupT
MLVTPLIFCILAAFADLLGGALLLFRHVRNLRLSMLTAIGSGFLLGATLLDRIPDAMQELPASGPVYILLGYLFLFLLERLVTRHHHGEQQTGNMMHAPTGLIAYLGMLIHTYMDGAVIGGAFSINRGTGILLFAAITMHKVPEGFSMATVRLASGGNRGQAFRSTLGLALSTIAGGVLTTWLGAVDTYAIKVVMALAAGSFLYITASNLIPALKTTNKSTEWIALVLSVIVFYVSLQLVQHVGLK